MAVTAGVDPVRPRFERSERSGPVGEMELPGTEPVPRLAVEVRQRAPPRLERPVRAVRRCASRHLKRERWTVVGAALAPEGRPCPSRVVLAEGNLRPS